MGSLNLDYSLNARLFPLYALPIGFAKTRLTASGKASLRALGQRAALFPSAQSMSNYTVSVKTCQEKSEGQVTIYLTLVLPARLSLVGFKFSDPLSTYVNMQYD